MLPRMSVLHGIVKRGNGQMPIDGIAGLPAHHPAAEQVNKAAQVQPALVCRDVGEVRHPGQIRQGYLEILLEQIGKGRGPGVGYRRLHAPAPGYRHQPCRLHQSAHALAAHIVAALAQLVTDLPGAVDAVALIEDVLDLRRQFPVPYLPHAVLALLVFIIPLPAHLQQLARMPDADLPRCFLDDSILYCGFFAKYADTFFRKSFSASSSRMRRLSC